MQPKKNTLSTFIFDSFSYFTFFKNLNAMKNLTLMLSYQFGIAGESPIPTPKSLKMKFKKILNEHKNKILYLKEEFKIQPSYEEKTNFLLALPLILMKVFVGLRSLINTM